jgi:hypothetical protein
MLSAIVLAMLPLAGLPAWGQEPSVPRTQVYFTRPSGMEVRWVTRTASGKPGYGELPLQVPGRYNFPQGATYRLKLSKLSGYPGPDLYPTLEVGTAAPSLQAFLSHSAVPLHLTDDDIRQVQAGGYLVKVVYLATASGSGYGAVSSATTGAGEDAIEVARRRGAIVLVLRIGNIDAEIP